MMDFDDGKHILNVRMEKLDSTSAPLGPPISACNLTVLPVMKYSLQKNGVKISQRKVFFEHIMCVKYL